MQETSKNESCSKALPSKLLWRLTCRKVVAGNSSSIAHIMSLCAPVQKVGRVLLISMFQRETCEICKGGKHACCSLDLLLLSLSTPSLFTQIGFLEHGVKKGRQLVELPWECVNSSSRAGARGGMVLKPCWPFILYKRMKREMRSQAPFTGELFPKIILACSKIWLEIPSFLQLMDELSAVTPISLLDISLGMIRSVMSTIRMD